jgi:hypothetical protein
MHSKRFQLIIATVSMTTLSLAPAAARERTIREIPVEVMLYDTAPARNVELGDPLALGAAQALGPRKLQAYVVRFKLDPGESLVMARGLLLDGATPRSRANKPRFSAAKLIGTLGYTLAMRKVPTELTASVGPLAGMLFPGRPGPGSPARASSRTLILRGETMHQSDGHAAALIMLEANALTRLEFSRVITRKNGKKKRNARSRAVLVQSGPRIAQDELLQLLSGRPVETLIRNTQPLYRTTVPRPIVLPPELSVPARTAQSEEGGFGPPQP